MKKIVTRVRPRQLPELTQSEKRTLNELLYRQWLRVPQMHGHDDGDELFLDTVRKTENGLGPMSEETRIHILKNKNIIKSSAWAGIFGMGIDKESAAPKGAGNQAVKPNRGA